MNNKILLTGLVLASLTGTTFAAGINNTVNSTAAYYGAEAYGNSNKIEETGRSAFVAGYNNTVSANNALVYGVENKAEGINSLVGGEYSKATGRNSVAIGSSAQALQNDTFAIGSQARANGTDALAFGNGAYAESSSTVAIGKTVKAKADSAVAIGVRTSASGNSTVAIGRDNSVTSADTTVLGSNNGTVSAEQSVVIGYNNKVVSTDPEQVILGSNSKTGAQGAIAVGTHAEATAMDAIALGNNTLADNANSVAIGTNSVTDGVVNTASATIAGKTYNFAGTNALSTVSVGSDSRSSANGAADYKRTITNVAAGRISDTSTDAVNGSQLNAAIKAIDKNHQDIKDTATGLQMLGDIVADHEVSIAANKQAAADAMAEAKKHGSVIAGDNVEVTTSTNANGGTEYKVATKKDVNLSSANFGSVSDPVHNTITKDSMGVFDGNVDTQYKANGVVIKNHDNLDSATHDINGVTADSNGRHIAFTTNGIDAGSQIITNVKAGENDTDAVNVKQLKNTKDQLAGRIDGLDQKVNTNVNDIRTLENTVLDHEGRITVLESENKDIKDAISDNSKLIDKNTKDIAKNTSDIKVLDNKITDVGRNALERANHYTDLQVNKGVAKASALAGLKFLDYNPKDKWSFAASVGHYRNANAVAVGAAYQPNENTMVHGGITVDGKVAYNLGVSFKTGGQKQVTRQELEEQIRQLENNNIRMQEELNEIRAMLEKK